MTSSASLTIKMLVSDEQLWWLMSCAAVRLAKEVWAAFNLANLALSPLVLVRGWWKVDKKSAAWASAKGPFDVVGLEIGRHMALTLSSFTMI